MNPIEWEGIMKKIIILLILLFVISCTPVVKFAQTGKVYPPYNGPV